MESPTGTLRKGKGNEQKSQRSSPKLRGLPSDSIEVRTSKTLSYILRHGAAKEGVPIRDDGYVKVTDLLANPKLRSVTLETLQSIVKADAKQRFELKFEGERPDGIWIIKANQGHSLMTVQLALKPVLAVSDIPSGIALHGTNQQAWQSISRQGLSKMKRNHIHLAQGRDAISGMRKSATVHIYVDVQKALDDGIKFSMSENGVILTEGDSDGFLPPMYFSKVEDSKGNPLP